MTHLSERRSGARTSTRPAIHPPAVKRSLLIGGLLAVVLAAFVVRLVLLVLWLALVAIAGLVVRRLG